MAEADEFMAARIGSIFRKESLEAEYRKLDEARLPIIPYDATIDELCRLLEGTGVYLVNAMEELSMLRITERKCDRIYSRTYAKVYAEISRGMPGATKDTIKMVVENRDEVIDALDALDDIRNRVIRASDRVKELETIDQDVRKLLGTATAAMTQHMQ